MRQNQDVTRPLPQRIRLVSVTLGALAVLIGYGLLVWHAPRLIYVELQESRQTPTDGSRPALTLADQATMAYNARVFVISLAGAMGSAARIGDI